MQKPVVAIADIHGMLDVFLAVVGALRDRIGDFRLITLGDHVDRGPDSAGVIDFVMNPPGGLEVIALKGNHEEAMVNSLLHEMPDIKAKWLKSGGIEALESYGYRNGKMPSRLLEHLEFMQNLPACHDDGKRLFVHGGVDPWKPLHEQTERDFIHSRKHFLQNIHQLDRLVVHGHTPSKNKQIEYFKWRINLDTAVFKTGRMPAVVFETQEADPRFFMGTINRIEEVMVPMVTRSGL